MTYLTFPRCVHSSAVLVLAASYLAVLASCATTPSNAKFDRTVSKIEKRNLKKGRTVRISDVTGTAQSVATHDVSPVSPTKVLKVEAPTDVTSSKPVSAPRVAKAETVLSTARSYLGTPHRLGGMSRRGIDCSGLVFTSFKEVNVNLPRSSEEQSKVGKKIDIKQVERGDLLFFTHVNTRRINHVGVVSSVENGKVRFIHTSTSKGVREDDLAADYWRKTFVQARRVL